MSTIRKIFKHKQFVSLLSLKLHFSPNYEYSQNTQIQTEIKQVIAKNMWLVASFGIFEAQGVALADSTVHPELLSNVPEN